MQMNRQKWFILRLKILSLEDKIIFFAQFPGEINGATITNSRVVSISGQYFIVETLNISIKNNKDNVFQAIYRPLKLIRGIWRILESNSSTSSTVYFTPSSKGLSLSRELIIITLINVFGVKRKIIHIHDGNFFENKGLLKKLFLKAILMSKFEFIVPSNVVKNECLKWNEKSKVNILYGYSRYELKEILYCKEVRFINFYGNFQIKKGLYEFLAIIDRLSIVGNLRINIIGSPDEIDLNELSSLIHSNRNSKYIEVVQIKNPKELIPYSIGAIIVSPTYGETFGLAVLECMSLGMVPVVNAVGGLKELVVHNDSGYLVENNSIDGYIDCIDILLSSRSNYTEMRERAFNQSKRFSRKNFNNEILKILRDD